MNCTANIVTKIPYDMTFESYIIGYGNIVKEDLLSLRGPKPVELMLKKIFNSNLINKAKGERGEKRV